MKWNLERIPSAILLYNGNKSLGVSGGRGGGTLFEESFIFLNSHPFLSTLFTWLVLGILVNGQTFPITRKAFVPLRE